MPKQSLCIFKVIIFNRNLEQGAMNINGVFQCDRNPKKGATQHARGTTLNKPTQNLKKKHEKVYLFKRANQYSGLEISLKIA